MGFLIEDIITSAKYRSMVPISQNTFQSADITIIADEELLLRLVSDIMSVREDFFLRSKQTSITANIDHYTIPKRAVGNSIKALWYVDTNSKYSLLQRIDVDEKNQYDSTGTAPEAFYLEGDEVVLVPCPSITQGSIEFSYYGKPNRLAETADCCQITNVSSAAGTTTFTVDTDLTASLSVGDKIDIVSSVSPFLLWADDVAITAITTTTIAVATTDVDDANGTVEPQTNDYICPAGYSNIPMIPEEFHPVLAQMVACRLLGSLGDLNKQAAAKAELLDMRREALKLIKNRVESTPDLVNQRNGLVGAFG